MIKRIFVLSLFFLGLLTTAVKAVESYVEILGVQLPHSVILDKTKEKVFLNGHAVMTMWGGEAYVGALYTPQVEKRAEMLLLNDEPLAMLFYFVQDDITPEMISKLFTETIIVNNGGWDNIKIDKTRILELKEALQRKLNAGDELAFYYSPQNGILMELNGDIIAHWPHAKSFFNMILRIWIGPYPPTRAFKRAILNFPINKS